MDDSSFSRHPWVEKMFKGLPLAGQSLTGCWRGEKNALGPHALSESISRAGLQEPLASTTLHSPQPPWEDVMTPFYRLANQGTASAGTQLRNHLVLQFLRLKNGSDDCPSPTGLLRNQRRESCEMLKQWDCHFHGNVERGLPR